VSTTPVLHQQAIEPSQLTASRLDDIERIAHRLARVSWIPDVYKPVAPELAKPWLPAKSVEQAEAEIAAAGMYLASIGRDLTPMTLKLVYVVNGAVDCMYDLISAQVHAHGHELWVEEESHESATVAGKRQGNPRVHRVTFTYADAVRGGLTERWSKKDGKKMAVETYAKWTRDMLVARAGKRCAKRVAPEAMLTMPPPLNFVHTDSGRIRLAEIVHDVDDQDDDIADAELVEPEQGQDAGLGVLPDRDTGEVADPDEFAEFLRWKAAGEPRIDGGRPAVMPAKTEPAGVGDNGTQVVGVAAPPPPQLGRAEVLARAVELGRSDAHVIKKARDYAAARGVAEVDLPRTLDQITDAGDIAKLSEWLG